MTVLLVPVLAALVVVALDVWVLADARHWVRVGTPVTLRLGAFRLETPESWFVACLLLWIFFFPTYLVARRS